MAVASSGTTRLLLGRDGVRACCKHSEVRQVVSRHGRADGYRQLEDIEDCQNLGGVGNVAGITRVTEQF